MRSNWRLTRADLRRRKWLFMPLPVAVTLNRRLAPLCVLSFCFFMVTTALSLLCARLLLQRTQQHRHRFTFEARALLNVAVRAEQIRQLVQQCSPDLRVSILAAPEQHGQFDLVAIVEELRGAAPLRLQVVIVDLGT